MFVLFRWLWGKVKALFGLVLPMLGQVAVGLRSWLFWIVHIVLLVGIVAGLFWLNWWLDLPQYLVAPTSWLAEAWLPILFLLVYLNLWAAFWLWRAVRPEARSSPFPDIDAAWSAGLAGLRDSGFELSRLPLFVVLGRPRSGDTALFEAAGVRATPLGVGRDAPVRLFLTREAVFVTSTDCSLLSGLAVWSARTAATRDELTPAALTDDNADEVPSLSVARSPDEIPEDLDGGPREITLGKDATEMNRLAARLRHLCFLIRHSRGSYVPLNGILVLAPEACTRTASQSGQAGHFAAADLETIADVLQVRAPVLAAVVDAESMPGLPEFLDRIPPSKRGQRLGKRVPYVTNLPASERATLIDHSVRWIVGTLVPRLVYRVMPIEDDHGLNSRLFCLVAAASARCDALARFFTRALAPESNPAVLPGGCYLAATGTAAGQQGFLADLFAQLLESQNFLAWTPEGIEEEHSLRWKTWLGYFVILLVIVAVAVVAVLYFTGNF